MVCEGRAMSDQISENAANPKKVQVDGQAVEQHSLLEQIEADRYVRSKAAAADGKHGFVLRRFRPGGAA